LGGREKVGLMVLSGAGAAWTPTAAKTRAAAREVNFIVTWSSLAVLSTETCTRELVRVGLKSGTLKDIYTFHKPMIVVFGHEVHALGQESMSSKSGQAWPVTSES